MFAQACKVEGRTSATGRRLVGLLQFVAVLAFGLPAAAQAVPGATGSLVVLADNLITPTTVAVQGGVAFVPEGQFARLGIVGGLFQARPIDLNGAGVLADKGLRRQLPGNDFFPEGIAADAVTGDLFVGSIFQGALIKFPAGSNVRQQLVGKAPNASLQRGALGLRVDNARNLLWVCDSNLGADPARPGGTVVGLNLANGAPVVRHELPANNLCNDIILDAAGNLLITETLVGQVFRIDAANALVTDSAQLFLATPEIAPPAAGQLGANGLAIAGGILFVSNTFAGTLVRFDLNAADVAGSATNVVISEGGIANVVLSGPDGVLPISDTELLVVENGFAGAGLNRVVRVTLNPQ